MHQLANRVPNPSLKRNDNGVMAGRRSAFELSGPTATLLVLRLSEGLGLTLCKVMERTGMEPATGWSL
jgi:hypothetical protein